ncbi:hypothetical protein [Pseudorhodoplanes sp.]|nr:hypothetical protein [Pseudorhodoplanes sp.]HWV40502.1 hypothetical protein [Pseudorhodoplanes sp.]
MACHAFSLWRDAYPGADFVILMRADLVADAGSESALTHDAR